MRTLAITKPTPETGFPGANCEPGSDCDCAADAAASRQLSWPATLALVGIAGALCLLLIKFFGA